MSCEPKDRKCRVDSCTFRTSPLANFCSEHAELWCMDSPEGLRYDRIAMTAPGTTHAEILVRVARMKRCQADFAHRVAAEERNGMKAP